MNMQKKWITATVIAVLTMVGSKVWAANTNTVDATITVTPVANVSMSLTPSSYAFGNLSVNTSSVTATAMTLANTGDVDISVTKQIQTDAGNWISDTSSTTVNHYRLYVATAAVRPNVNGTDFSDTDHLIGKSIANTGAETALKGLGGGSPIVNTSAGALPSVSLWYRLDMPTTITTVAGRTTVVRFTGTAQ